MNGYKKELEIVGIGYRGQIKGNNLVLNIGYSHPVEIEPQEGVKIEYQINTSIIVSGIDKESSWGNRCKIRAVSNPEPYKGKGIKYKDETYY